MVAICCCRPRPKQRGYVGRSKSENAVLAEERGLVVKSHVNARMLQEHAIPLTRVEWDVLTRSGYISREEHHHTGLGAQWADYYDLSKVAREYTANPSKIDTDKLYVRRVRSRGVTEDSADNCFVTWTDFYPEPHGFPGTWGVKRAALNAHLSFKRYPSGEVRVSIALEGVEPFNKKTYGQGFSYIENVDDPEDKMLREVEWSQHMQRFVQLVEKSKIPLWFYQHTPRGLDMFPTAGVVDAFEQMKLKHVVGVIGSITKHGGRADLMLGSRRVAARAPLLCLTCDGWYSNLST